MSDFELPSTKARKPSKPAVLPPSSDELKDDPVAAKDDLKEGPTDKPEYDQEELLRIFDEIIFAGEYGEQVIIKNRLKVGFRTRSAAEIEEISIMVDGITANLISTLNEKRSVLNLQYALTSYQGRDLRTMKVEERAKFVRSLPGPIIGALLAALHKFDQKVFIACQEGEENF